MIKELVTKLHTYLGLFFLVYLWLFSLTGLFLNHPSWGVNDYRQDSKWVESTTVIVPAQSGDRFSKAEYYLSTLQLEGELTGVRDLEKEKQFRFEVNTPGEAVKVRVNSDTGETQIRRKTTDTYGMLNQLHIFNGMQRFDKDKQSLTWFATILWFIAMDALAGALILMVLFGFYMWLQTRKLIGGLVSLLLGVFVTGLFLFL